MSEFPFEVGDIFEGGAAYLSRFLSEIMAVGGRVEFDGDKMTIVSLGKEPEAPVRVIEPVVPVIEEPVIQEAVEPVVEEIPLTKYERSLPVEVDPPLVDLAHEEVVPNEAPAPKVSKLPRPKKAAPPVTEEK